MGRSLEDGLLSDILSVPVQEESHDIEMGERNRLYAIISYAREVVRPGTDRRLRIRDNALAVFTVAGEVSGFVSMFDLFAQEIPATMQIHQRHRCSREHHGQESYRPPSVSATLAHTLSSR